jgi:hypothetical protein
VVPPEAIRIVVALRDAGASSRTVPTTEKGLGDQRGGESGRKMLPPSGGPTQTGVTARLAFRVTIGANGEAEITAAP